MSRGLGHLQRECIRILGLCGMNSAEGIAVHSYERAVTESQIASFRRALRKLARRGQVIDMDRRWVGGVRIWALPSQAKEHCDRWPLPLCTSEWSKLDARIKASEALKASARTETGDRAMECISALGSSSDGGNASGEAGRGGGG